MRTLVLSLVVAMSFSVVLAGTAYSQSADRSSNISIDDAQAPRTYSQPVVQAEDEYSHGVVARIIPQASLVLSGFAGNNSNGYTGKMGFGAGGTVDLGDGDLVFEPGLLFRQMGADLDSDLGRGSITANYVSAPFAGKYYLAGQRDTSAFIKFGLLPSFLVSTASQSKTQYLNMVGPTLANFDLDYIIGIGGKIQLNHQSLMVGIDYIRGITNVLADSSVSLYNYGFLFTAGMGFDND